MTEIAYRGGKLYARGDTGLLGIPNLAVVGTRHPTDAERASVRGLVRRAGGLSGRCIVSGLALGCDAEAHAAALGFGLPTIAVLPCAIDTAVPRTNGPLARRILEAGGLLISQYPPGTPQRKWMYVRRDGLLADLADGIIVAACDAGGGTMHTVNAAVSRGKPVGCIPSPGMRDGNREILGMPGTYPVPDTAALADFLKKL